MFSRLVERYRDMSPWEKCDVKLKVLGVVSTLIFVGLICIGVAWGYSSKVGEFLLITWAITSIMSTGFIGLWLSLDR